MVSSVSDSDLLKELRALRERVEALEQAMKSQLRVRLEPIGERAFFGQPVTIRATVTREDGGPPAAGAQVTLITTWGKLRTSTVLERQQGGSVTVRTEADGTAQVVLIPPRAEELQESQQAAIETVLDLLDAKAATPRETRAGLTEMVKQYLWEANHLFREAVDIYFGGLAAGAADSASESGRLDEWRFFDSTVMAFVQKDASGQGAGNSVQAAAALSLRFKDWLGPWLETYLDVANSDNPLPGDLTGTKDLGGDAASLLDDIYDRVNDFAANQRGAVGAYVGRKVAEKSLREFADSGIADLPLDTKVAIANSLTGTSDAIANSGARALAGIRQSRANLSQEIDTKLDKGVTGSLAGFHDALSAAAADSLQGFLDGAAKVRSDTFTGFQQDLNAARSDLLTGFQNDALRVSRDSLDSFRTTLNDARSASVRDFQNDVVKTRDRSLGEFQRDVDNVRARSFKDFQTDVSTHRTESLSAFQDDAGQVRKDVLIGFQNDVSTAKTDSVKDFQTTLRSEAANLQLGTRLSQLEGSFRTVNDNVTTLREDVRRIKRVP
jgi:hypothetical protein